MKIYIELIIVLLMLFCFVVWKLWKGWSLNRILKKYKPEDDKSKRPEGNFGRTEKQKRAVRNTT